MAKHSNLIVFGMNHRTAPVAIREKYQISRREIPSALKYICSFEGIEAVLILATCNRLEFYITINRKIDVRGLVNSYFAVEKLIKEPCKDCFYSFDGDEAVKHLFRVIAGLDSVVLGEYQIQGQVKEAYSIACEANSLDKVMHKLVHAAFRLGKKVRNNTSLGHGKQSVSGVASQLMADKLDKGSVVTIIGVNENSKIVAENLIKTGINKFIFVNRTEFKAQMMAEKYGGQSDSLDNLEYALTMSDAVFTSTGADDYIISSNLLQKLALMDNAPGLIVDMAIPRDTDTSELPEHTKYYDLENIKHHLKDIEQEHLKNAVPEAEKIIEDELRLFHEWQESLTDDIMGDYSEKFEKIRQQLLEEYRGQFGDHSIEKLDKLTKSLLHRTKSTFVKILVKNRDATRETVNT